MTTVRVWGIPCITLLTEIHLRGDGLEDEPFLPSVRQGELNLSLEKRLGKASEKVEEKPWKTRKGHPVGAYDPLSNAPLCSGLYPIRGSIR